jgi:hypothetical protein
VENPLLMIFIIGVIADMPMKGDEMEGTCSLRGKGAKCVQDCSRKVLRRPTAVSGRSRSAVSRLLGLWFQKKKSGLRHGFFFYCECVVQADASCDMPIPPPGESYEVFVHHCL